MVQIVDTSSSGLQLSSADMSALSPQGNRLGHVGASLQPVSILTDACLLAWFMQFLAQADARQSSVVQLTAALYQLLVAGQYKQHIHPDVVTQGTC